MTMPVQDDFWGLSEKERETLRLIVRGHDAKSIASTLGLSVHTINERLRDARRKMTVSSSREAARLLLEKEDAGAAAWLPQSFGDTEMREDADRPTMKEKDAPVNGAGRMKRPFPLLIGVLLMTLLLAFLALSPLARVDTPPAPPPASTAPHSPVVETARQWLSLVDQGLWEDSYKATGKAFRKLNTLEVWSATSRRVRVPLGVLVSRDVVSEENLPAPPYGYQVVKFRSSYANRADVIETIETIALNDEDGHWRVVGVAVE